MKFQLSKFTVRIDTISLKKLSIIAEYNARSANQELGLLIKKYISDFEKVHGKIEYK